MSEFVECPWCKTELSLPAEAHGQKVSCASCGREFHVDRDNCQTYTPQEWWIRFGRKEAEAKERQLKRRQWIERMRILYNFVGRHRKAFVIVLVVMAALLLVAPKFRYTTVKGSGNVVYLVDNFTGKTRGIAGAKMFDVKGPGNNDSPRRHLKTRSLSVTEVDRLTGRMGINSILFEYSGSIYNGNSRTAVTVIRFQVTTVIGGKKVSNIYTQECDIQPMTVGHCSFKIIIGDTNAEYQWRIIGADGYDTP